MIKELARLKMVVAFDQAEQNTDFDRFELLYDTYAPKIFGFILKYADTKDIAQDYLSRVFLKIWSDIKNFEANTEAKIMVILLAICKPLYKTEKVIKYYGEPKI